MFSEVAPGRQNFNPHASLDDGSCVVAGCTLSQASNYNPSATLNDESCIILVYFCVCTQLQSGGDRRRRFMSFRGLHGPEGPISAWRHRWTTVHVSLQDVPMRKRPTSIRRPILTMVHVFSRFPCLAEKARFGILRQVTACWRCRCTWKRWKMGLASQTPVTSTRTKAVTLAFKTCSCS